MSKCIGYKRKAKFAPGSELIDETNHFLVIDIIKDSEPGSYLYKVYDYDTKEKNWEDELLKSCKYWKL